MDCSKARTKDPVDWLETCPDFSWPLASQVHEWIMTWEADLTESIKWNMLCFSGRKLVCGLSACKKHLGITFFRGTELADPSGLFQGGASNTNILSIRVTSLDDFDHRAFQALLHAAVALDADPTMPPAPKVKRDPWPMPDFFRDALAKKQNSKAAEGFNRMSASHQREYIVWLTTAKRSETRKGRLESALAALRNGRCWARRKDA